MEDVDNDGYAPPSERVTVQWSIFGEATGHRYHPYGSVFGGKHATYHHNLYGCNISWEPTYSISTNPEPEDLNLINNVKEVSQKNISEVDKLKGIVSTFNIETRRA